MLEYRLKENAVSIDSTEPMKDYLRSLGITEVDSFMYKPKPEEELSPWLLDNVDKAIQVLHNGFTNNKKFFLQVDSDVDGMTSSTIFYRFFKGYYPNANIQWRLHDGKEHGVIMDSVPADADIIVLPDSGSMQLEEQEKLVNSGKVVLIMDHHDVSERFVHNNVVLVNNQISEKFTNKHLTGAGVVFKVIQAYSEKYPNMYVKASDYYDLAALGILADMGDMRNLDNNYIAYAGLHNIKNEFFKAILRKQEYSITSATEPTKIDVVFYVAPLINGVIREGDTEEKEIIFKAFIEEPSEDTVTTTYRGKERNETFYEFAARTAYNVKNRQNTKKVKCFEFLKNRIIEQELDKHKIIVVVASKDDKEPVPQNITGLIAMELQKEFEKPVLVLRPKYEDGKLKYAGSGRGKFADGFNSFLYFVKGSKYCEYGEGHAMAFGAQIDASNYQAFIQECDERLVNVDFSHDYIEVDAIFNRANINYRMLYEFAKYKHVYGQSIPETRIAIEAAIDKSNVVVMGKDGTTVKVNIERLPCIKFKDMELVKALTSANSGKIRLIGRPQINEWMGRETTQLFIDNIEFEPLTAKSLF